MHELTKKYTEGKIFYCVRCGLVVYITKDKYGNAELPVNFPAGRCRVCNHDLIQVDTNESIEIFEQIIDKVINEMHLDPEIVDAAILTDFDKIIRERYVFDHEDFDVQMYQKHIGPYGNPPITYEQAMKSHRKLERYMEDMRNGRTGGQARCPRCGSTSISTQKKGFGLGKAIAGVFAVGTAGALAGAAGSNKTYNVCQKCGHKWTPGK